MAHGDKIIRVGLIGCNRRALWYGAIFDRIRPRDYAGLAPFEYHHMTVYRDVELRIRKVSGFQLCKVYDDNQDAARTFAAAFRSKPAVCSTLDEVSDEVELVFIANEDTDGAEHPRLARPGLNKGVATFIDRPLAFTVKEAKSLLALSRRKHAPLFSYSHVALMPHVARFQQRYAEIGELEMGMVQGIGPNPALVADSLALTIRLFGDSFGGRADQVQSMGQWPCDVAHVRFRNPGTGRILQALLHTGESRTAHRAFFARAISHRQPIATPNLELYRQAEGGRVVMEMVREMVRTGQSPLSPGEMFEPVVLAAAARRAHNKAKPVQLADVR